MGRLELCCSVQFQQKKSLKINKLRKHSEDAATQEVALRLISGWLDSLTPLELCCSM